MVIRGHSTRTPIIILLECNEWAFDKLPILIFILQVSTWGHPLPKTGSQTPNPQFLLSTPWVRWQWILWSPSDLGHSVGHLLPSPYILPLLVLFIVFLSSPSTESSLLSGDLWPTIIILSRIGLTKCPRCHLSTCQDTPSMCVCTLLIIHRDLSNERADIDFNLNAILWNPLMDTTSIQNNINQ